MHEKDRGNGYWAYSVAVYSRSGVAASCLTLQDSAGLDVNVLLIALWATGLTGRAIQPDEIALADCEISAWRKEVVQPLRNIRRGLKTHSFLARELDTDGLRNLIKTSELEAERIEQSVLATWAVSLPLGSGQEDEGRWIRTAEHVVEFYASKRAGVGLKDDLIMSGRTIALAAATQARSAGLLDKMRHRP